MKKIDVLKLQTRVYFALNFSENKIRNYHDHNILLY